MPQVQLVVVPTQGFANRMKMIASTAVLAKLKNTDWKICWEPAEECNIELKDIFPMLATDESITKHQLAQSKYTFFGLVHTESIMNQIDKILNGDGDGDGTKIQYMVITGGHEFKHPSLTTSVFLKHKKEFYSSLIFHSSMTNEVPNIQDKYIAVHYRDIDMKYDGADVQNGQACRFTENSPLCEFKTILSSIRTDFDYVLVLSNSDKAYDYLSSELPNMKICYNKGETERNTLSGMAKSITDFIRISRAQCVIGSYYSSFSDESAFLGNITKYIPLKLDLLNQSQYHCYGYNRPDQLKYGTLNV